MMKALLAVMALGLLTACETTGQSFAINVGNVSGGYVGGGYGGGYAVGGPAYYQRNTYVIPYGPPPVVGYYVNPVTGWNTPVRPVGYNNCQPRVYVQNPW